MSNPFLSLNIGTAPWVGYGIPNLSARDKAALTLANLIPANASVLADSLIFPFVSSRLNAYTVPPQIPYGILSFTSYIESLVGKSEYVIMQITNPATDPGDLVVLSVTALGFGVLGYASGVVLLKRGYSGAPFIFQPLRWSFNYVNLTLEHGQISYDPLSQSGKVLTRTGTEPLGSSFWSGPRVLLPPGGYQLKYYLRIGNQTNGSILSLNSSVIPITMAEHVYDQDIGDPKIMYIAQWTASNMTAIQAEPLIGTVFNNTQSYVAFTQNISANQLGFYEFSGTSVETNARIYLDKIELKEITPSAGYSNTRLLASNPYSFQYAPNLHEWASLMSEPCLLGTTFMRHGEPTNNRRSADYRTD